MPTYRLHDQHEGDDLGLVEHPAPNVEPGDVLLLADGRETLVTARVETGEGTLAALSDFDRSSPRDVDFGVSIRREPTGSASIPSQPLHSQSTRCLSGKSQQTSLLRMSAILTCFPITSST